MNRKLTHRSRSKCQSLISTNKIKPEVWRLSESVIIQTLKNQGLDVKKIKKIKYLQHQVCISYWNDKGGVCSGFFSYRIFEHWQAAVQKLVSGCGSLYQMYYLNQLIESEFARYPYPTAIQAAISDTVEVYTSQLAELASYQRNLNLVAS